MPDIKKFDENVFRKDLIPKGDAIGEIVGSLITIVVVLNWDSILRWLILVGVPDAIPLPNATIIGVYASWIVWLAALSALSGVLKFFIGRWHYVLAAIHTVYSLFNAGVLILMVTSGMLLRPETITAWSEISGSSTTRVQSGAYIGLTTFALFIALVSIGDSALRWVQARHGSREAAKQKEYERRQQP